MFKSSLLIRLIRMPESDSYQDSQAQEVHQARQTIRGPSGPYISTLYQEDLSTHTQAIMHLEGPLICSGVSLFKLARSSVHVTKPSTVLGH